LDTHKKTLRALLRAFSLPVKLIAKGAGRVFPHSRHSIELTVGVVVFFSGSFIATHYPHDCFVPHFIWDGCAYFIHAVGATPLIEALLTEV
jgi:hypothetical protein